MQDAANADFKAELKLNYIICALIDRPVVSSQDIRNTEVISYLPNSHIFQYFIYVSSVACSVIFSVHFMSKGQEKKLRLLSIYFLGLNVVTLPSKFNYIESKNTEISQSL